METEKSLVKTSEVRLPKFVEQAYDSIEGMKQFANMLLESKLVPDSYYEKGVDNKPDYTKGKTSAVVIVLLQAQQLAVPPMTGLQHIVPVNGLLSIKGDLAKTMIFASGKLKKDSWKEVVTGSIEEENMVVSLTATREDNGVTLTRTFSVDKAKRMGLWVTTQMVGGQDGWKHKKSAWYKTPDRMLQYRALGNLARDLFSDVLLNMYTTEEAVDIDRDATEIIETESGAKITIPDKDHAQKRSGKMTERVADKIPDNKFGAVSATIQDAVIIPDAPEKKEQQQENLTPENKEEAPFVAEKGSVGYMEGKIVMIDGKPVDDSPVHENQWTLKQMEEMDTKILLAKVNSDMDMMEACEMIPGKNTNKKLREIIDAWQRNDLTAYVAPYMKEGAQGPGDDAGNNTDAEAEKLAGGMPVNKDFEKTQEQKDKENDAFLNAPMKPKEGVSIVNKYGIEIVDVELGKARDFSEVKKLFNALLKISPTLDNSKYQELATKMGYIQQYPDRETFLRSASAKDINLLLNQN